MRPLSEFGSWELSSDITDRGRKDIMEGAVATYSNPDDLVFMRRFDPAFKKYIGNVTLIDQSDLQYFKVFCMYCLEVENDKPVLPDIKLEGFGDTVVVFRDFNSFLLRFFKAIEARFEEHVDLLNIINYYGFEENRRLNPLFEKTSGYSYQKELRLAICQSERNKFYRGHEDAYTLIPDKERITLNVGDIRDIAYATPFKSFLGCSGIVGVHYSPVE